MNKVFSSLLLCVIASAAVSGQTAKPTAKRTTAAKSTSSGAIKAKKPKAANTEPQAPVEAETDETRYQKALAAATAQEKAKLLRAFVDEFPESPLRQEALEYLVLSRAMIGEDLMKAGEAAGAAASFTLAVEEAPSPVPDRLYSDVLLKIPTTLFFRGLRGPAFEVANAIEKKVAGNAKQLLGLTTFYLGIENGSEARRVAEAAIAADPGLAAGYQALGLAHRLNFDIEESAKAYAKALEVDPNSVPAKRSLAEMKRASGHPDEAANIYRAILATDENDTAARGGLAMALFDSGNQKEAEAEMARTIEREPKNFGLLAGAAYWYAANRQGTKAVEYAQKAVDAEPRYVWARIALARGLMAQGKPLDAERALIKAKQYGNFPTLEYEIASARYAAGLYREAADELKKSFTVRNGMVATKLGGRVAREADNFQELVAWERKASMLQPKAAEDAGADAKLKLLLEIERKVEESPDEVELAAMADDFVRGEDKMKLHRQLHMASLLLQRNLALPKVAELVRSSIGNADAGLEVPAPGAAVMASELYESRTIAFSRNEVVVIPDVPRQTLSAILRGRIEDLAGWTMFQQKNYPDAVLRLRRAASVLPAKSAWWRGSMWRLGSALEADGKDKEALESYIQSYKAGRPSAIRYSVIESLYRRLNGSIEGLEDKIGPSPGAPIAAMPVTTDAAPASKVETAKPETEIKADPSPAPAVDEKAAEKNTGKAADPAAGAVSNTPPPESVREEKKEPAGVELPNRESAATALDSPKTAEPPPIRRETRASRFPAALPVQLPSGNDEMKAAEPQRTTRIETVAADKQVEQPQPERSPAADESPAPKSPSIAPTEQRADEKKSVIEPEAVKAGEEAPARSYSDTPTGKPATPPERKVEGEKVPEKDPAAMPPAEVKPPVAEEKRPDPEPTKPDVTKSTEQERPKEIEKEPAAREKRDQPERQTETPVEIKPQERSNDSSPAPESEQESKPDHPNLPAADKTSGEPSSVPEGAPNTRPSDNTDKAAAADRRPAVIVEDRLKPTAQSAAPQATIEAKPGAGKRLFEPVIIKVPNTWVPRNAPDPKNASIVAEKDPPPSTAATRSRVIAGKEVVSDQRCSIDISDERISLLNGGGSLGVMVSINGEGEVKDVKASTTSIRDIAVLPEPEIEGVMGRRFYVIKSISTRLGIYQVNFESPCGKREIAVQVR